jgi:hypothetical protein
MKWDTIALLICPAGTDDAARSADVERRPLVRLAMKGARSPDTDIAVQRCAAANAAAYQSVSQFALL